MVVEGPGLDGPGFKFEGGETELRNLGFEERASKLREGGAPERRISLRGQERSQVLRGVLEKHVKGSRVKSSSKGEELKVKVETCSGRAGAWK